jgi:hypothetical protein
MSFILKAWVVTFATIGFLNDTAQEYEIRSMRENIRNDTGQSIRTKKEVKALLIHSTTIHSRIHVDISYWWHEYIIVFKCYDGQRGNDNLNKKNHITDPYTISRIQTDLKRYLAKGLQALSAMNFDEETQGLFAIAQEDPRTATDTTRFQPVNITDPPSPSPTSDPITDRTDKAPMENESPDRTPEDGETSKIIIGSTYYATIDPTDWVSNLLFVLPLSCMANHFNTFLFSRTGDDILGLPFS